MTAGNADQPAEFQEHSHRGQNGGAGRPDGGEGRQGSLERLLAGDGWAKAGLPVPEPIPEGTGPRGQYEFTSAWFEPHEQHWRRGLVPWAADRGPLNILEIGSYEGRSTAWILENLTVDANSRVVCVDMWVPQEGSNDWADDMEAVLARFKRNVAATGKADQVTVLRGDSDRILDALPEGEFDLVYVDGDHSAEGVYRDSVKSFRLLKDGGKLLWDDYFWSAGGTVKEGIDRACDELGISVERLGHSVQATKCAVAERGQDGVPEPRSLRPESPQERSYYSQNGEDFVLWALFDRQDPPGFFLDVGALDGIRFSNTYSFEQAGWSGICVEAHPDYIDLLRQSRPRSTVVHAAVGAEDQEAVDFYANKRGTLSTLDPSLESEFQRYGKFFSGWDVKRVPMRCLTSILDEHRAPSPIDVVSIDIEGTELAALQGFDLSKYQPRVVVVEALDQERERQVDAYMQLSGYVRARSLSSNIFFCRDADDANVIAAAPCACKLIHAPHPCDRGDGEPKAQPAPCSPRPPDEARASDLPAPGSSASAATGGEPSPIEEIQRLRAELANLQQERARLESRIEDMAKRMDDPGASERSKAQVLAAELDRLLQDEKPLAEVFRGFVLKDDSDHVLTGARFPLSQNCIHALARHLQPRSYLEIGTRYGYSVGAVVHGSAALLRAVTVDIVDRREQITQNIESIRHVDDLEVVCTVSQAFGTDELFDFVYVDGGHTYATALHDLGKFWHNVRPGGLMLVDDTINERSDGEVYNEQQLGVLKAVREFMAAAHDIDSAVVQYPTYSGFCIIVKSAEAAVKTKAVPGSRAVSDIVENTPEAFSAAATPAQIQEFLRNPENVVLISFPRTGSHWLRSVMELYFARPTLTRCFYKHDNSDALLLHDHDKELSLRWQNVIYLYRDPVDTVFSQINYYGEDERDPGRIDFWGNEYGRNLSKWLSEEDFTRSKLVLRYEDLRDDPVALVKKLCELYHAPFDEGRARAAAAQVSKESVRKKTEWHNPRVQNVDSDYEVRRRSFREECAERVWAAVLKGREQLRTAFADEPGRRAASEPAAPDQASQQERPAKIVGLVAARNEELFIEQCIRGLAMTTDAIVVFDDASDDDTVRLVESLAQECRVEEIVRNDRWDYDEHNYRSRLLEAGRRIGGTHFIAIDADEMFTANLTDGGALRKAIVTLKPQEQLAFAWIQLWRGIDQYRFDTSVWTNNYKAVVFCDDGISEYPEVEFHLGRTPNVNWRTYAVRGYDVGLLHFQFVNWRNMLVKQAWYRCLERVKHPDRPAAEINELYAPSKDERGLALRPAPRTWFETYGFFEPAVLDEPEKWRESQVLAWFEDHGREHFADLDIWDVDWGTTAETGAESAAETEAPLVSAIVSCYDSERFIRGCLEDLEGQTIADRLEIVVVDSGSEQNERAIVKEFQSRHSNIVYVRTEEREGVYAAWNRGIRAARGKYITNANTDDRRRSDALERMACVLDSRPDVALVYADVSITQTENETFDQHTPIGRFQWYDFDALTLCRRCFMGPQPMWRRSLHEKHGYFDESLESAGDWEFWLRMAESDVCLHIDETLGLYLRSPHGVEHRDPSLSMREAKMVHARYAQREAELREKQSLAAGGGAPESSMLVLVVREREPDDQVERCVVRLQEYSPASGDMSVRVVHKHDGIPENRLGVSVSPKAQRATEALRQGVAGGASYVLMVRPSVEVSPFCLDRLMAIADSDRAIAAVGPTMGTAASDESTGESPGPTPEGAGVMENVWVDAPDLSDCCVLLRSEAVREVGGLPAEPAQPLSLAALFGRLRDGGHKVVRAVNAVVGGVAAGDRGGPSTVGDAREGGQPDVEGVAGGDVDALLVRARRCRTLGRYADAIDCIRQAALRAPRELRVFVELGALGLSTGNRNVMQTALKHVCAMAPGHPAVERLLCGLGGASAGPAEDSQQHVE